jgi:hypothetical protein
LPSPAHTRTHWREIRAGGLGFGDAADDGDGVELTPAQEAAGGLLVVDYDSDDDDEAFLKAFRIFPLSDAELVKLEQEARLEEQVGSEVGVSVSWLVTARAHSRSRW